jgi:hypothetical protein
MMSLRRCRRSCAACFAGGEISHSNGSEGYGGGWGPTSGFTNKGSGSAARYFKNCPPDNRRLIYQAKAPKSEKGDGINHETTKPLSLMRYLVRLTKTPYGGVVLDMFGGSGTTAEAAILEGRECIIVEREAKYIPLILGRIGAAIPESEPGQPPKAKPTIKQMKLF